jgi:peptidoglycan hydrolase CwlO-like protein
MIAGLGLAMCLLAVMSDSPVANAGPLEQDRAKARELAAEVAQFDARIDAAVLRYDKATLALSGVHKAIRQNRNRQRLTRNELEVAQTALSTRIVALYKDGEVDPLDVVFGADDFGDIVAQITMVQRVHESDSEMVQSIAQTSQELADVATALTADLRTAKRLVAERSDEYASIREQLGQRRALLAGVRAEIRALATQKAPAVADPKPTVDPPDEPAGGNGQWWPLIQQAAGANGVSARGMYRLMMIESGGSATIVGPGGYWGLFQYAPTTWKGSWNPYRSARITDGAAQIRATALALRLGYGHAWWDPSYSMAF